MELVGLCVSCDPALLSLRAEGVAIPKRKTKQEIASSLTLLAMTEKEVYLVANAEGNHVSLRY